MDVHVFVCDPLAVELCEKLLFESLSLVESQPQIAAQHLLVHLESLVVFALLIELVSLDLGVFCYEEKLANIPEISHLVHHLCVEHKGVFENVRNGFEELVGPGFLPLSLRRLKEKVELRDVFEPNRTDYFIRTYG